MKPISILLITFLFTYKAAFSQEVSVVRGKIHGPKFSKISLRSEESPLTGAIEEYEGILLDSGKFEIHAELYVPNTFIILVNDVSISQILLCPGADLTVNLDSSDFKYFGATGDFVKWNKVLYDEFLGKYNIAYAETHGIKKENTKGINDYMLDLRKKSLVQVEQHFKNLSLSGCEETYFKDRVTYSIYSFLWSDYQQKGQPIESKAFQFMNSLPLDHKEAVIRSLDYNRAISIYLFYKLRLANKWYENNGFDPNSDAFQNLFYDQILKEIKDEDVKNVTLTRKVISLLSSGDTAGEPLFKRYLNDCSNSFYRKIAYKYYNDYIKLKNYSKPEIHLDKLSGTLFDQLKQHKGKILYVDFWASWCKPCIESFPFVKKLQEKHVGQPLEIIFVSMDDNIGSATAAAKKLGLSGTLIYLNKEQSIEIRKALQIQGIPHYTLIDKTGKISSIDAPKPDTKTIEIQLSQLLSK